MLMIQNKVKNAAEFRGLEPEQILKELNDEAELRLIAEKEGIGAVKSIEEPIPHEVQLIAQALAYRSATLDDLFQLHALLAKAYEPEINVTGFRNDVEAVCLESVQFYLEESSQYQWLLQETPDGRFFERDGAILGACCFSTDGVYRNNVGEVVGRVGSIRFLAVPPKYHGLCLGRRLLSKVEDIMRKQGCSHVLASIPSTRDSMIKWIQRRGYEAVSECAYPFSSLGHLARDGFESLTLCKFVLILDKEEKARVDKERVTHQAAVAAEEEQKRIEYSEQKLNDQIDEIDLGVD